MRGLRPAGAGWWAGGLMIAAVVLHGCAAAPLMALGGSAVESATGLVVRTGTEYTMTGTAHRTFTIPVDAVHAAVLETFRRTAIAIERDETSEKGQRIVGRTPHRTVRVRLTPITSRLTSMELVVKRNALARDKATTSELLEQVEQVLAETPQYAQRLHREPTPSPAASP